MGRPDKSIFGSSLRRDEKMSRGTYIALLIDPRKLGQEEQLPCHSLSTYQNMKKN